jgi:hypothetical protein
MRGELVWDVSLDPSSSAFRSFPFSVSSLVAASGDDFFAASASAADSLFGGWHDQTGQVKK